MKKRSRTRHAVPTRHPSNALPGSGVRHDDSQHDFLDMLSHSQRTIFQICLHFTDRQPDHVRDLYQDIVCTLWESWPSFCQKSNPDTWVRRVALNVAVSELRRHARQPQLVPLEEWVYDTLTEEIDSTTPDYYRLIDALDPEERALLYLRLDKMPLRDIAAALHTTEPAIKQRLYRLRKKINDLKQQEYDN